MLCAASKDDVSERHRPRSGIIAIQGHQRRTYTSPITLPITLLYKVVIASCVDQRMRATADAHLDQLLATLGEQIVSLLLMGLRGDGPSVSYLADDSALTHISTVAVEVAMELYRTHGNVDPKEWARVLNHVMDQYVLYLAARTRLLHLCGH